ncbi:MAG: sigma-54 dependent transcriptional regulator, partial [Acidobacteria bacterium]|nr:sigma-54 dependent transcriptional regulator [Acidobacteriota bacterium]
MLFFIPHPSSLIPHSYRGEQKEDVRILVVDDEAMMADSLKQNLVEEGYTVDTALSGADAIELFDRAAHHVAICDVQLPDMDGLEVLRHIKDAQPATEVIIMTGFGTVQRAVEATKAGAFWFLEKPFEFEVLLPLIERAIQHRELIVETETMRRNLSTRTEYFNIIGASRQMQQIYETIESVAKSDANVLIVGESGTGKELIANAIHYNSLRVNKPFIKVNCAALPKELIESELFGHTKGAFTGAHADKDGLIQHAAGGSLLLDEIAEMPVELQPKLLRVLQERSYRKIGSERTYA